MLHQATYYSFHGSKRPCKAIITAIYVYIIDLLEFYSTPENLSLARFRRDFRETACSTIP